MLDYIPQEIWVEILSKLSPKSLIRSTSVCKAWQSLIRSPSFISFHLTNAENQLLVSDFFHNQQYAVIPKREPLSIKVFDLPFKCPNGYYLILVGSCNGLLCFTSELLVDPPPVIIWNPFIKKHVILPQSVIYRNVVSWVVLGFGVVNNIYKVVKLVYDEKSTLIIPPRAEILTLDTGRWRELKGVIDLADRVRPYHRHSVFFKGCSHWIGHEFDGNVSRNSILTFHVGEESFGEIGLPEELERRITSLAVMGESLGAFYFIQRYIRGNVWMMKDYGVKESWTKLYSIDSEAFKFDRVIGFLGSEEVLLADDDHDHELITYNAKTNKWIKHGPIVEKTRCRWYMGGFKESLVLLEGYSEESREESSLGATISS